jgi:hypothetical protein
MGMAAKKCTGNSASGIGMDPTNQGKKMLD